MPDAAQSGARCAVMTVDPEEITTRAGTMIEQELTAEAGAVGTSSATNVVITVAAASNRFI